jgi:DNA-binding LacI/PurR family transcriptional regulator
MWTRRAERRVASSLRDVAAQAGVSVMTVSNVINGRVNVAPKTRAKVERAIAELNYRPNLSARNLARGRSGVVAFGVPEIAIPYFAELARFVIDEAERRGWTLLIEQTDARPDRESEALAGIRPRLVDGLILYPAALTPAEIAARAEDTPLVLFGGPVGDRSTDHVVIDNLAAGRGATEHLISLGRSRIAVIGPLREPRLERENPRLTGYREAIEAAGLPYREELVQHAPAYHRRDGAEAMRRLLDEPEPPDAVFCFSDLLAAGAMHTALSAGARVPEDIALVGFDDVEEASFLTPTLTSVRPDKRRIAELAVQRLALGIEQGRRHTPKICYAEHELIRRQSTLGGTRDDTRAPED